MQAFFEKISQLDIGWNQQILTEDVFFDLCKRHGVGVKIIPLGQRGFYHCRRRKHHIALNEKLVGNSLLFTMFHEFGHYLMHSPSTDAVTLHCGTDIESRDEAEANAFAYCALLPLKILQELPGEEIAEMYGTTFFLERLKVYERYGI